MQIWQPPAVFFYLRLGFHSESKDVEVNRFKDTKSLRFAIIFNSSGMIISNTLEMFYLNSTLNFGIPPVLVYQIEVYYEVDRLLTGLTAQQKGTNAQ